MSASAPAPPIPPPPETSGTVWGAVTLRYALYRLRILLEVVLVISILALSLDALGWARVFPSEAPVGARPFVDWWTYGAGIGVQVAIGLAIAILVIVGIIYAVTGAIAWRRGVLTMDHASYEFGPAQVEAAHRAREDHSVTLWLFVVYVGVAIAASVALFALNATLAGFDQRSVPVVVGSTVPGVAAASVLVAIYFYGTRHLVGFLHAIATPEVRTLLVRGRDLMIAGAIVGIGAGLGPIAWPFDALATASLAILLFGANDLLAAYTIWLGGRRSAPLPLRGPQVAPA